MLPGILYDLRIEPINADAHPDLLTSQLLGTGETQWFAALSNASGGFDAPTNLGFGTPVHDLNGDGRIDLVRVLSTTVLPALTTFEVQLSNASGGFTTLAPQTIASTVFTKFAKLGGADLDNDGLGDVLAYGEQIPHILIAHGDGAGSLSNMVGYPHGATSVTEIATADLEGDGDTDLLACTVFPNAITILESVGPAWFLPPAVVATEPGQKFDLVLADFDVDGDLDVAYRTSAASSLRYLAGDGQGGFAPSIELAPLPKLVRDHIAADYDADGDPDLVVSLFDELGTLPCAPGGAPGAFQSLGTWRGSNIVRFADVDQDGQSEWIAAQQSGVAVVEPTGPRASLALQYAPGSYVEAWCASDFDTDGRADTALCVSAPSTPLRLQSYRWGGASFALTDTESLNAGGAGAIASANFDADGRTDLCVSLKGFAADGSLRVFHGGGDATFNAGVSVPTPGVAYHARAADIDLDGAADLVTWESMSQASKALVTLRGDGAGGLAITQVLALPNPSSDNAFLELADFDVDGALDALIAGSPAHTTFAIARGNGAGGFDAPQLHTGAPNGAVISDAVALDNDADGRLDVLLSTYATDPSLACVYWARADGAPASFEPPAVLLSQVPGFGLDAADLDRDGARELLVNQGAALRIARGAGSSWSVLGAACPQGGVLSSRAVELDGNASADLLVLTKDVVGSNEWRWLSLMPNVLPLADGLATYGVGTPSCGGAISAVANVAPRVGASDFRLSWTNAPASASALVGIAFSPDVVGTDVFGVGVTIHIGLLGPVFAYTVASDAGGAAALAFPVPNVPELAGVHAYTQALWIEPVWQSCSSSALPWSSSGGLEVTVLP